MHEFSLFGFVVSEGMGWLQSCFFSQSIGWAYQSDFCFSFFEGKINQLMSCRVSLGNGLFMLVVKTSVGNVIHKPYYGKMF